MPPLKAQLLLEESLSAYFPEMVFTDSGITVQLHRNTHLRLADGAATEAQAEVLFKLLLYLANALVKQTTLQGDVAQQVGPHLAAAHRLGQRSRAGLDAMTTGAAKELMFGHPVADLGQVKDLMDAVGFVMKPSFRSQFQN